MPYPSSRFIVFDVPSHRVEMLLNDLERMASGTFDIISMNPKGDNERVVVRMNIVTEEPVFNEEEIKRKLGFV